MADELLALLDELDEERFEQFKVRLKYSCPELRVLWGPLASASRPRTADLLLQRHSHGALALARRLLERGPPDYSVKYREHTHKKYRLISERNLQICQNVTLNSRYTRLMIVSEPCPEEEKRHEILSRGWRHAGTRREHNPPLITVDTLFSRDETGQSPQIIVLVGAAGIGKTMTARKVVLDWASGELYKEEFEYVFYINCRETIRLPEQGSVADMMLRCCPDKKAPIKTILEHPEKLLFIIDGFDELRFSFDQPGSDLCCDPTEEKPVSVILSSLFQRTVLPECYLLITTRPTALEKLRQCLKTRQPDPQCSRYAEILGFSEQDREEYFCKFFKDDSKALEAFSFVRENEVLFTMCFVPIVCWILCTVLKQQMERGEDPRQTAKTLTEVYMLFLFSLVTSPGCSAKPAVQSDLRRLCSLAAAGVWEQRIVFEEDEIKKSGLDEAASLPLFLNETVFTKDIDCESAYSFLHLSIQEFFAALSYVLEEDEEAMEESVAPQRDVKNLLNHYGESRDDFMLTVRFLFGLLNVGRMKDITRKLGWKISAKIIPDLLAWFRSSFLSEAIGNLDRLHCLFEIQEEGFVREALHRYTRMSFSGKVTHMDQVVLSFCMRHCIQLESLEFSGATFGVEDEDEPSPPKQVCREQKKHSPIYLLCEALKGPQCKVKRLWLRCCRLPAACCGDLAAALSTSPSLTELDLSENYGLGDGGVRALCKGLRHPSCKLQTLRLSRCHLTPACCGDLAAALSTSPSLTQLDLRCNRYLGAGGVRALCEGLRHPSCKVQTLGLGWCNLPAACCGDLAAALSTSPSLTELDLSYNYGLGDGGVRALCEGLRHPSCKVQTLRLSRCHLTPACCGDLAAALSTSPSLTQLDLSDTKDLGAGGVRALCEGLRHPSCKLQTLGLRCCNLPDACCGDLAAALSTSPSLTELNLSENFVLGYGGVRVLCEGLRHPSCKVQTLRLWWCRLPAVWCEDLAAVLSTSSSLTELDLSENDDLGYGGVRLLCEGLRHPSCKLQTLRLGWCNLPDACCGDLAAALSTSPSLTELDLRYNDELGVGGVQMLCGGLRHPSCKVQTLRLGGCRLTAACCGDLAAALSTSPSLTEVDLRSNCDLGAGGVRALCEGLRHPSCKVQTLGLSVNKLNAETKQELEAVKGVKPGLVIKDMQTEYPYW